MRLAVIMACLMQASCSAQAEPASPVNNAVKKTDRTYDEIEAKLRPLATPLARPQPGDWLAEHKEDGQTFREYLAARPVRRTKDLKAIYLVLLGDFTPEQRRVIDITSEYLAVFYQTPVKVQREMPLAEVPARARRKHPAWGMEQIQTPYVLDEVLKPTRSKDALAYLCFTSSDLYPDDDWNFVFGQASLRDRTGVWSIYRKGDPAKSPAAFAKCLTRTLHTASHETGHILTMQHCTALECNMNGVNSLAEADRRPLHLCPVCLRKVCWNLQLEPDAYLAQLEAICQKHALDEEAAWYARCRERLAK